MSSITSYRLALFVLTFLDIIYGAVLPGSGEAAAGGGAASRVLLAPENIYGWIGWGETFLLIVVFIVAVAQRKAIGRWREAERRVAAERDRAQRYIDVAGVIILVLDDAGLIRLINRKGVELLGYPEKELVGRDWFDDCLPERCRKDVRRIFAACLAGGAELGKRYETPILTRNGEERIIRWHNTLFADEGGRQCTLSSGEDITERTTMEKAFMDIENSERARIGRDLHDGIGQLLTGISFKSMALGKLLQNRPAEALQADEITALIGQAKDEVRMLTRQMSPLGNDADALIVALEGLAATTRRIFNISCVLSLGICPEIRDRDMVMHLYRIAQEAVTNAVRHAGASRIDILFWEDDERVGLTVRDDGVGFSAPAASGGMGLKIMNHRARLIGGHLTICRRETGGSEVFCAVRQRSGVIHHAT